MTFQFRMIARAAMAMALAVGAMSASTAALALEAGDWLIRVRAIGIEPTGDSNGIAPDLLT